MSSIESKGQIPDEFLSDSLAASHKFAPIHKNTRAYFRAGAEWAYHFIRAHSSQPIGRLPWVIFAESKPPEHGKRYAAKILLENDWLVNGVIELSGSVWLVASIAGQINDFPEDRIIYWLDESPLKPIKEPVVEKEKKDSRIKTLQEVVDWIDKDIVDHAKEFPDGGNLFVQGAMTALKNLKYFIDLPSPPSIQQEKEKGKIKLKIIVNGWPTDVECELGDTFLQVAERALMQTQNTGRQITDWNLIRHDDKELWPESYVGSYSWKDGDVLFLSLKAGIGAAVQQEAIPDQPSNESDIAYVLRSRIKALRSELSALREEKETGDEFNGSLIDQLKCELKSAHEEKEEYRKALREIYNGQSSKHHTYEDRLGPKDMAIIAMRVLDKYPSSCAPIPPDPDKALILSVLKWAHDIHINRAGQYWGKDYSNIAYGDDGIVREYLQSLTHKQE